jgi:hypothetical protein
MKTVMFVLMTACCLCLPACQKKPEVGPNDSSYFEEVEKQHAELRKVSAHWKQTHDVADFLFLKQWVQKGGIPRFVKEILGDPLHVSKLANGGEAWLYVKSDADKKQYESWSVVFDGEQKVTGVFSKPIL